MTTATALREIPKLFGKSYATGAEIPAAVISQMTPQALRALVDNRTIQVEVMSPGTGAGMDQHLKAKVDGLEKRLAKAEKGLTAAEKAFKTLQASYDDLAARMAALDGGNKPARKSKKGAAPRTEQ